MAMQGASLREFSTRMFVLREREKACRKDLVPTSLAKRLLKRVFMLKSTPLNKSIQVSFLDLPYEIRLQIYQELFPNVGLVIWDRYNRSPEKSFKGQHNKNSCYPLCQSCRPWRDDPPLILPLKMPEKSQNSPQFLLEHTKYWRGACYCYTQRYLVVPPYQATPLLRSCHQVHDEYLDAFYNPVAIKYNTFKSMVKGFPKSLHNHLNLIRTIDITWCLDHSIYDPRFTYGNGGAAFISKNIHCYIKARHDEAQWELACETLSKMPLLANLKISLLFPDWRASETTLLTPLLKIVGLKSFLVMLEWHELVEPVLGEVPFTIVRPYVRDPNLPTTSPPPSFYSM